MLEEPTALEVLGQYLPETVAVFPTFGQVVTLTKYYSSLNNYQVLYFFGGGTYYPYSIRTPNPNSNY